MRHEVATWQHAARILPHVGRGLDGRAAGTRGPSGPRGAGPDRSFAASRPPTPAVEPSAGDLDPRTSDEIASEILSEYPLWKDAPDAQDLADVVRSLGSEATRAKLDELLRGR
jgi:hypothetical protein